MIRAGVDPGLLDEVSRWRTDDLWFSALEALVTYMRAAVARGGETVRLSADGSPAATMSGSQPRPDLDAQIAHPRPQNTRRAGGLPRGTGALRSAASEDRAYRFGVLRSTAAPHHASLS